MRRRNIYQIIGPNERMLFLNHIKSVQINTTIEMYFKIRNL